MRPADEEFDQRLWVAVYRKYRLQGQYFLENLTSGEQDLVRSLYRKYGHATS